jgi:hypothetical protein
MKITPKKGYILASNFELPKKNTGILIIENKSEFKGHMKVESDGLYSKGSIILPHPYKPKIPVDDNLFLIDEDDILAIVEV